MGPGSGGNGAAIQWHAGAVDHPGRWRKALIRGRAQESQGRVAALGGPREAWHSRQTLEWKIRNLNIDKLAFRKS